ncbi:hypothetical protein C0992_008440 [Termitomyces sp. T32_za158]|nr:hypothetical protein C0992_008440 [Termitomyces sp. T32_za158]
MSEKDLRQRKSVSRDVETKEHGKSNIIASAEEKASVSFNKLFLGIAAVVLALLLYNKEALLQTISAERREQVYLSADIAKRDAVVKAFQHAWSAYERDSMGNDKYYPVSKTGTNLTDAGAIGYTVVDALDTIQLMGLDLEYTRARKWIANSLSFNRDGGLLSAYHLSGGDSLYLERAQELADRLMPAFNTPFGLPTTEVNLAMRTPVEDPNNVVTTAEIASIQLELRYLSHLAKNDEYWDKAENVMKIIKKGMLPTDLASIYIGSDSGQFLTSQIRLGFKGNSYYEYLLLVATVVFHACVDEFSFSKQYLQTAQTEPVYREMYERTMAAVHKLLLKKSTKSNLTYATELVPHVGRRGRVYVSSRNITQALDSPRHSSWNAEHKQDHLVCFIGGSFMLGAITCGANAPPVSVPPRDQELTEDARRDWKTGMAFIETCMDFYKGTATGLAPEIVHFGHAGDKEQPKDSNRDWYIKGARPAHRKPPYDARPETVESLFLAYRLTGDEQYRQYGWDIFQSIEKYTRVETGGYATILNVDDVNSKLEDRMETFFLSETLKYLFLLFSNSNIVPLDTNENLTNKTRIIDSDSTDSLCHNCDADNLLTLPSIMSSDWTHAEAATSSQGIWHSIRPWAPPLSLSVREVNSVSVTFILSSTLPASNGDLAPLAALGLIMDEEEAHKDQTSGEDNSQTVLSKKKSIISDALAKGLSVDVNGSPWQRVFIRIEDGTDEAVIIIYGLMPGREYDVQLGLVHGDSSGVIHQQVTTTEGTFSNSLVTRMLFADHLTEKETETSEVPAESASPNVEHSTSSSDPPVSTPSTSPSRTPPMTTVSLSIEDQLSQLQHTLSLVNAEREMLAAALKTARRDAQKADAAIRSEIETLKRASEKHVAADHRAKQKILSLQEAVKRAQIATSETEVLVGEMEVLMPELDKRRQEKELEYMVIKDKADRVRKERERQTEKEKKKLESMKAELAGLTSKMEKLNVKKEKLENSTINDLEEQLRSVEQEIEQAEKEAQAQLTYAMFMDRLDLLSDDLRYSGTDSSSERSPAFPYLSSTSKRAQPPGLISRPGPQPAPIQRPSTIETSSAQQASPWNHSTRQLQASHTHIQHSSLQQGQTPIHLTSPYKHPQKSTNTTSSSNYSVASSSPFSLPNSSNTSTSASTLSSRAPVFEPGRPLKANVDTGASFTFPSLPVPIQRPGVGGSRAPGSNKR